jgi:predicted phage baseplate assembly protein
MTLPAPNLDDRTFQALVDEAKRFIQKRCPEWSNHNVADPGITLVETFAWMTEVLLYRLNRVPDRNYIKFLELIGVQRFAPSAARCDLVFRLSAPQDAVITIPRGTSAATPRPPVGDPVVFTTEESLDIVPARSAFVGSKTARGALTDFTHRMGLGEAFLCFSAVPEPDDALYIGLDQAAPSNTCLVRIECEVAGHGIVPTDPPIAWEAWDGESWVECEVKSDTTGGFNLTGEIELHLPRVHVQSTIEGHTHGWLRCRVVAREGEPYRGSPTIHSVACVTVGGYAAATHADFVENERLGNSAGVAGQTFHLARTPVTADEIVLESWPEEHGASAAATASGRVRDEDATRWRRVDDFAHSGPHDHHFTLDPASGTIRFGPSIRLADGTIEQHGAIPPINAALVVRRYSVGGGAVGNVLAGAVSQLRSSLPYVKSVTNLRAATGGVDGESVAEAAERGPIVLRTLNRAVTAEDFESLARQVAPEVARVHCVPDDEGGAGALRLLVVPHVRAARGPIDINELIVPESTRTNMAARLEEVRVIGTRIGINAPTYVGVKVTATLRPARGFDPQQLADAARDALYAYLNPVCGGPASSGWPLGRPLQVAELFALLRAVSGTDLVDSLSMFEAHPISGRQSSSRERIEIGPTSLVLSHDHQVSVETPTGTRRSAS